MDYSVVFSGRLRSGMTEADVRANFSRLFNLEPGPKLDRLFNGQPVTLKKGLDAETARKYADTLLRAGAICDVQSGTALSAVPATSSPKAAAPASNWQNMTLAPVEKKKEAEPDVTPAPGMTVTLVKENREASSPYAVSASGLHSSGFEAENNSGHGAASEIPEEARGLAWGAFFFNWLWGPFNGTWIALLCLVPYIGIVVAFYLLFKGRELAWQNKRWNSVEHFNRVQRRWAVAFLIFPLLGILAAITLPAYSSYRKKAAEAQTHISAPATPGSESSAPPGDSNITDEHQRLLEQIQDPEARRLQRAYYEQTDRQQ